MTVQKFDTKEAAQAHALANYETDEFPGVSTGVVVVWKLWGAQAKFMGLENGFYINLDVENAGL